MWMIYRLFTLNGTIREHNKKIVMELGFNNSELIQLELIK